MASPKRKRLSSSSSSLTCSNIISTIKIIKGCKRRHCHLLRSSSNIISTIKKIRGCKRRYPRSSSSRQYSRRDWSNMGVDLLEDIHKKLPLANILICRAVCSLWRSVSQNHIPPASLNSPPPILWEQDYAGRDCYWFLDVTAKAGGNLYLPTNRETAKLLYRSLCYGSSSQGYLLFHQASKKKKNQLSLLHPLALSALAVRLPSVLSHRMPRIQKALVLCDPIKDSSCCYGFVALGFDEKLLFAESCGATTQLAPLECQNHGRSRTDMICINNYIYAIRGRVPDHHYLEAWDFRNCSSSNGGPRKVLDFQPTFSSDHVPWRRCDTWQLVESLGELLLVAITRPTMGSDKPQTRCTVYKMDFKEKKWVHMDSLGDRVLFVMEFQTLSLSAKEFPQYERNSVYFRHYFAKNFQPRRLGSGEPTIDNISLGIFNMEDGSLKKIETRVAGT